MIIRNVTLVNYGIYGGRNHFDLQPVLENTFNRPVSLFRGKNGVGKTTFVDAIRLGLHGSLAIGNRVGQREFDDYLRQAIHHSGNGKQPVGSCIDLEFDYVHAGKRHLYRIQREWTATGNQIDHALLVWEDDKRLTFSDSDVTEQFLRELVPPGVVDLFFFDGERIETLAANGPDSNSLLADTVKTLLGLDLVEQLSRDLDIYLARSKATEDGTDDLQEELSKLNEEQEELEQLIGVVRHEQWDINIAISDLSHRAAQQQQRIASEGGRYAEVWEQRLAERNRLEVTIDLTRHQVQELCSGLMPFAISPDILKSVSERLKREKSVQETRIVNKVVSERLMELKNAMQFDEFWDELGLMPDPKNRQALLAKIGARLTERVDKEEGKTESLILHFSEHERELLLTWIEETRETIPRQFSNKVQELSQVEEELRRVNDELALVPADETLGPLVEKLNEQHTEMARLQHRHENLEDEERRLSFHLERVDSRKDRVRELIEENRADDQRIQLTVKMQRALSSYNGLLTDRKVAELERLLIRRFNQLCRKKMFLDRVEINRDSFMITPYRLGKIFNREQLSAGEQQLFAIATL